MSEEVFKLPVLYSTSSNGKIKQWGVLVYFKQGLAKIVINHGYKDGKLIENIREIAKGKNAGRANETTPFSQAVSEAKSKWNKKIDEGYTENLKDFTGEKKAGLVILPMLALSYEKRAHDILFPCFVQPKLDGIRSLYYKQSMWSRKGKEFLFLDHIKNEIFEKVPKDVILDGEIYSDSLSFQELTGLVRKKKLNKDDLDKMAKIKWVVYDYISNEDYAVRLQFMKKLFSSKKFENIELLKTELCNKKEDIQKFLSKYEKEGYEGLIIRNKKGAYKTNYRSKDLQKYKSFIDDEFKIVDFTQGEGNEKGLVIWVCETKSGQRFSVRPQGTHEERAKLFKEAKKYIGEMLTVRYQELTTDGNIRFGVGIGSPGLDIRDYE